MAKSENKERTLFADGWLVLLAYFAVFSWTRWVSPGGFALLYRREALREGGFQVRGRTWLQDFYHLGWATASIGILFNLDSGWSRSRLLLALAVVSFRLIDLFIDCNMLAVFGNRYGRPWQGAMRPKRLHRTLVVDFLVLLELIFWNACFVFLTSKIRPELYFPPIKSVPLALHLSVSTATTIGYGTYAPVETISVLVALVQALSMVLLLTGVIAGVFSRNVSLTPAATVSPAAVSSAVTDAKPGPQPLSANDTYDMPVIWDDGLGWRMRWVLPLVVPLLAIGVGWRLLLVTGWLITN